MKVTDQHSIDNYYQALLDKNPAYLGIFFVGVKTTSVFCIATCRARKPKKQNVEFFTSFTEALHNGYRPCKVCKPTENSYQAPAEVQKAIELVKNNPKEKISDTYLREQEIGPENVRRWFKKHYGITFQAFQRMYRVNNAYQELKSGKNATHTAFDSGYESLSGFGYTFKKMMGKSPKQGMSNTIILMNRLTTPLGPMFVCATERGICLLEFVDRKMLETEFRELQKLLKATILFGDNEHIQQVRKELKEYFDKQRSVFEVALHTPGTEFQQKVWKALESIPYGKLASYQDQALKIEQPNAVRAVARANGANRVSILIPCHRVVAKDGKLTGYGGGLARKQWLINHERH